MIIEAESIRIPGTRMAKNEMGDVTGMAFLDKIFYIQKGIMLSNIREVAGIDGSTLQNWVKRGWTGNAVNKKYTKDQLARILIINMMRSVLQLEKIDGLLHYLNGEIDNKDDDILPESVLYDYICNVIELCRNGAVYDTRLVPQFIEFITKDFAEPFDGAKTRLKTVLEIVVYAFFSSVVGEHAVSMALDVL